MSDLPKHVEWAKHYGHIHEGWTLEDYLIEAVRNQGYETVLIHGVQGSGKSNRLLQTGFWIFKDWDKVLEENMGLAELFGADPLKAAYEEAVKSGSLRQLVSGEIQGPYYKVHAERPRFKLSQKYKQEE